jgi:hypothetical protein
LVERFFGHVQSMVSLAFSMLGSCLHLLSPPAFNSLHRSLKFRFVQELDPVGVYPGRQKAIFSFALQQPVLRFAILFKRLQPNTKKSHWNP